MQQLDFDHRTTTATAPTKQAIKLPDAIAWVNSLATITALSCLDKQPPLKEVIQGVIGRGSLNILFGESGTGKTWVGLDMGVSIANHESEWIGHKVNPGGVLYIDCEMGSYELRRRVGMVSRGHGVSGDIPFEAISLPDINLFTHLERDSKRLEALITRRIPSLVIIDPFLNLIAGADENSSRDVIAPLVSLKGIAERTDTALLILHHPGKNGGYRGSSAIKGAVDSLLKMTIDGQCIKFAFEKKRSGVAVDFGALKFFTENMFNLAPASVSAGSDSDLKSAILNELETGALTFNKLCETIKRNRNDTKAALKDLVTAGRITETKGKRSSNIYALTDIAVSTDIE